jgi:predicted RNA-binding Zn-ribbon protein involved in translation (DUF1610 family)
MKKIIGIIIILVGVIGLLLSALADVIGVWNVTQDNPDVMAFGWVQITGVVVGIVLLLLGVVFMVIGAKKPKEAPAEELTPPTLEDAGTVAPSDTVTQQAAQDMYGTQTTQDMYAQQQSIPTRMPAQQQAQTVDYSQQAPAQQTVDYSAGAQTDEQAVEELDGLEGLEDLAQELGETGAAAEKYDCPDCGATLVANATSCTTCGATFSEEIFECPVCGSEVPENANECPKCGEEFAE